MHSLYIDQSDRTKHHHHSSHLAYTYTHKMAANQMATTDKTTSHIHTYSPHTNSTNLLTQKPDRSVNSISN